MKQEIPKWVEDVINGNLPKQNETVRQQTTNEENNEPESWVLLAETDMGGGKIQYTWDTGVRIISKIRENGKLIRIITNEIPKTTIHEDEIITFWRD